MGTRNLTIVVSNKETKVAQYGQWDGEPGGQGSTALKFISNIVSNNKLNDFKEKIDKLRWYTPEEIDAFNNVSDEKISQSDPQISRDLGATILEAIYTNAIVTDETREMGQKTVRTITTTTFDIEALINSEDFASDSVFCEWAYVIDLDKETFEVYRGFNKKLLTEKDRFYHLQEPLITKRLEMGRKIEFYPIEMINCFDLYNLPTLREFLAKLEPKEEEDVIDVDEQA